MTVLRPSSTTCGIPEKSESSSTTWALWAAASLPEAIATLQSASLSANMSLTPSPVIATVFPSSLRILTKDLFWAGVTLPNTVHSVNAFLILSSSVRVVASTYFSAPFIPASIATRDTVTGLSPEITLISTPCFAKYRNVSGASFLIGLARLINAIRVTSLSSGFPSGTPSYFTNASVLNPFSAISVTVSRHSSNLPPSTYSGAPSTYAPSSKTTPLYLHTDENGDTLTAFRPELFVK